MGYEKRLAVIFLILRNMVFFLDTYEVTNKEYKKFIDRGGYRNPKFWKEVLVSGERDLVLDSVLSLFVDRTGKPGPATWHAGDYPAGQDDYPVNGIRWFEAAAYASYV
jgi:formylglycine-generating enzyme required for sulfatase activity